MSLLPTAFSVASSLRRRAGAVFSRRSVARFMLVIATARAMRIQLLALTLVAGAAFAYTPKPPDTQSWGQVTADFVAREAQVANDGYFDGHRLKVLDPKRAATFLISYLASDKPPGLRLKAIGALGSLSFQEAIPKLCAIALDETEDPNLRKAALTPGLRYMKHPEAVKTATALAAHESDSVRIGAYWVLSEHGTDEAIEVLAGRLRANEKPLLPQLILALTYSKHPRAGRIVFDLVDFAALPHDKSHLFAYSFAMERYRLPDAQQNMLLLAQEPDQPLSCNYALRYFSSFPREDVTRLLLAYIEADREPSSDFYDTITEFTRSPNISSESKSKLSALIVSGKVRMPTPPEPF